MGTGCSRSKQVTSERSDAGRHPRVQAVQQPLQHQPGPLAASNMDHDADNLQSYRERHHRDICAARNVVQVLDTNIDLVDPDLDSSSSRPPLEPSDFASVDDYLARRKHIVAREQALGFDHTCRANASSLERRAEDIVQSLRRLDETEVFAKAGQRQGWAGQLHRRVPGDHFLSNVNLIEETALFQVARMMPKGAHLHIHFNACLQPNVLLDIAKEKADMYITSNLPLKVEDPTSFDRCEIRFSILRDDKEQIDDLFSAAYQARRPMKFRDFLAAFPEKSVGMSGEKWLMNKLVFEEGEAYEPLQTAEGAWEKFNGRTRMMKGLFNYEMAFRRYTRLCLEDFVQDNIQYAEIRPNFMSSNQLYRDDDMSTIDNWGIMELIIEEVTKFKQEMGDRHGPFFRGLKVIYCTPRSFQPEEVRKALDQCLQFKIKWPEWIAGFDLVGEEAKGLPIKAFVPELLRFTQECKRAGQDIPFLFHCGETLDIGTDTDENLIDALLLNSKRIGHGFALPKHPYIMQQMKLRNVCVELCPISNEILGLTPRASGHAMYDLLANNVHCTVNSDNGTLFRSTLSHDFYQVIIGKADMGLYGCKQLILWSLEHACLEDEEKKLILGQWEQSWEDFLRRVVDKYSSS